MDIWQDNRKQLASFQQRYFHRTNCFSTKTMKKVRKTCCFPFDFVSDITIRSLSVMCVHTRLCSLVCVHIILGCLMCSGHTQKPNVRSHHYLAVWRVFTFSPCSLILYHNCVCIARTKASMPKMCFFIFPLQCDLLCFLNLSLIHIWRCRRKLTCRSRWSPYH